MLSTGERYLPDGMPNVRFYTPTDRGLESRIREKLDTLRLRDGAGKSPSSEQDR